jgi:coproporphyrinogen III oxidase-like Fe-S oxidoreductase
MGLRLLEGLVVDDLTSDIDWDRFANLKSDGFVWQTDDRIGATSTGRPVLNYIIAQLAKS